jgi:CBS domain-containing protein
VRARGACGELRDRRDRVAVIAATGRQRRGIPPPLYGGGARRMMLRATRSGVTTASRRSFSRLTIPTVPVGSVASAQELLFVRECDPVRSALDKLLATGQDALAVNRSRPESGSGEVVGIITDSSLMAKVRERRVSCLRFYYPCCANRLRPRV